MDFSRHTRRHLEYIECSYDRSLFKQVLKTRQDPKTGEPYQDISGLVAGLRRVVHSDPGRIREVEKLLQIHPKLIIFYNYDYELEELRKLSKIVPVAELNGHKHEDIPEERRWVYLVQYAAGAEAWNCIKTNALVFYSLTYSYKHFEQAQGRIDRLNTPYRDLYYYALTSNSPVDTAIRNALGRKEDFNLKTWSQALAKSGQKF